MTDSERLKALEAKVFDLSQLVYSLASVSPELPVELRQKFRTKYNLNNKSKAERMFEITPEDDQVLHDLEKKHAEEGGDYGVGK
jgi:hypothetical protein|tara:strand:- start:116 stop:367 length:252 start_codon:yes stop_codon:yes gene_type:complete